MIGVEPVSLDFGKSKVGVESELPLAIFAQSKAPLLIQGVTLEEGSAPGGASAFEVLDVPESVPQLSQANLRVKFRPTALSAYEAVLVINSNDEDHPQTRVLLSGEGAVPKIEVIPECRAEKKCTATVNLSPQEIAFAPEPFVRLLPVQITTLPTVAIVNAGDVELLLMRLAFEGPDAAAFSIAGNSTLPSGGQPLASGEGVNLSMRFTPTSEAQTNYSAQLVIESDDPALPSVSVGLTGTLRENLPPVVCANISRVVPGDGSATIDYGTPQQWAPLLVAPPGGYDFSTSRDIQPRSEITFSALSDPSDETTCSNDPEDGRRGLTFEWKVLSAPPGAGTVSLGGAATGVATMRPKAGSGFATGEYVVELTVRDVQGHATTTTLKFVVALKEDLVVQLSWQGFADVDLDLHLVRPSSITTPSDPFSGAFSFFDEAPNSTTSGDVNGWSELTRKNNAGFDFEWGGVGTADDPRLNIDDTGAGQLIENISLNYPENDPQCATGPCTYRVYVHYFKDTRQSSPTACMVTGTPPCTDGAQCDCVPGTGCVANEAPKGASATGAGKCFVPPQPVVRIFIKGNPTPAAVIPVAPDVLLLPAPCQMIYLADVIWPAKDTPDAGATANPQIVTQSTPAAPQVARFGYRQANSSQCSPNLMKTSIDWYALEP